MLRERQQRTEQVSLDKFYPDTGPMRRELYKRHLAAFKAGIKHRIRAILGGNRVGKTTSIGGYETALHLTGLYPTWWEGHRISQPFESWAAGKTNTKVRDINQKILFGRVKDLEKGIGGGLIPRRRIVSFTRKTGVTGLLDQVVIKHKHGHENLITLKSYEEGRKGFEGEEIPWIWLDEEPAIEIFEECLLRTLTCAGHIMATFTPLDGMTETCLKLLEDTDLI